MTVVAVAVSGLLSYALYWLKNYYLTKQRLDELTQAEYTAEKFVRAAEQKFNLVLDTAEQFVTPEQKLLIEAERKKFNESKKKYALDKIKTAYPSIDVDVLDAYIEGAVNYYKQFRREQEPKAAKINIVSDSGTTTGTGLLIK